ncbi:MAG: FAD:protein FMN transferase [Sediminimonas sp.]|uniref:FAD:protein FMN transferase n=1 Tax=Sediminimonas sp. TaxID=2823379 RepID=UPI002870846B|nr:FAD:protein FMN transferase [Sediminimonas sp.]MDR9486356.1 FAD:protein FMN transferase [Sediminimonas sp.]
MFTDLVFHRLSGPTMGTRWTAQFYAPATVNPKTLEAALANATGEVDAQMSTWRTDSDLMRLNAAKPGDWVKLPLALIEVLAHAVMIGRASDGAFDIGTGDVVDAWGFGPNPADTDRMRTALDAPRTPAHEALDLDSQSMSARKHAPLTLDLSAIAKGYGADKLHMALADFGVTHAMVGLDGEVRTQGHHPGGRPWTVAIERPVRNRRAPLSVLALEDAAIATSGDYRHWVQLDDGQRLSHVIDPARGGPLRDCPASVSVVAPSCMDADAWATALMVCGVDKGTALARRMGLNALFLTRVGDAIERSGVGPLFETGAAGRIHPTCDPAPVAINGSKRRKAAR